MTSALFFMCMTWKFFTLGLAWHMFGWMLSTRWVVKWSKMAVKP